MGDHGLSALEKWRATVQIALLLTDLEAGGAQRVVLSLAEAFVQRGHSVHLLVITDECRLQSALPDGITPFVLVPGKGPLRRFGLAACAVIRLATWLRAHRPDVLLSSITGANLVAALTWRLTRQTGFLALREASTLANVHSTVRLKLMRRLYPVADAVITLSEPMRTEMHQRIGISKERLHCIPNGVDRQRLQVLAAENLDYRAFNTTNRIRIVAVGRLSPAKDYWTLLKAFQQVAATRHAALFIIGEGAEREQLQKEINALGLSDAVFLVGFDANPWRWLSRADLFVLSSRWEGSPNSLLEALALGIPVVSTRFDDSIDRLAKLNDFPVVPCGDPTALAHAVIQQLGNPTVPSGEGIQELDDTAQSYLRVLKPPPSRTLQPNDTHIRNS